MDRGPIPLNLHAMLEPLMAVLVIAAPWIFGFGGTTSATAICVIVGALEPRTALLTRWDRTEADPIYTRGHGSPAAG